MKNLKTYDSFAALRESKVFVSQKQDESVDAFNDAGDMKIADRWVLYLDKDKEMPVGSAFININTSGDLALREIEVAEGMHNKGIGTKFMEQLCRAADANGWKIVLTPDTYKGSAMGRLKGFYKGFGFVENKGRNKDWSVWESMYREPESVTTESYAVPQDIRDKRIADIKKICKENKIRTEGDYVQVFHGTSRSNMNKIIKSGMFKMGTWFAADEATAKRYALTKVSAPSAAITGVFFLYMGSLTYNGYFNAQEDLWLENGKYSPKDVKDNI